jgi:hypothetical protein
VISAKNGSVLDVIQQVVEINSATSPKAENKKPA